MFTVRKVMTEDPFTLMEDDTLLSARSIMSLGRIRHIPIVDRTGDFTGLVTHRDILAATVSKLADIEEDIQDELDAGIPISEIMNRDVVTVPPDMSLRQAAEILLTNKYGCLPVVDGTTLVGIITEADFLRLTISLMDEKSEQS
ncbi:MAG: CBS domain-containing protein [Desulfohalobiaceae bacterium]